MKSVLRLETEFNSIIDTADEIWIAVAMLSDYGLSIFNKRKSQCHFKVLVGYDLPTHPTALQQLLDNGIEAKIYDVKNQFFHPKLYLFKNDGSWNAFVGSGNCTKGGLNSNIELNVKIDDEETVNQFLSWFKTYYNLGSDLTQEWLESYKMLYQNIQSQTKEQQVLIRKFKLETGVAKGHIPLKDYDLSNQFFGFKHYNAFTPPKPILDASDVIAERRKVSEKLIELHELVYPLIQQNNWEVYPHHMPQHITSSFLHHERVSSVLSEIWLHYGRGEMEIEKYKKEYVDNMTSLYHMRLELLIGKGCLYSELRVGKNDGSYPDREFIKQELKNNPSFVSEYFRLIQNLDSDFIITINNEVRTVTSFRNEDELKEFTLKDKIRDYYFNVGRSYLPDDKRISNDNIVKSIISDFSKLYPLYQLFKHSL